MCGSTALHKFNIFSVAMFGVALLNPLISTSLPQWPMPITSQAGNPVFSVSDASDLHLPEMATAPSISSSKQKIEFFEFSI